VIAPLSGSSVSGGDKRLEVSVCWLMMLPVHDCCCRRVCSCHGTTAMQLMLLTDGDVAIVIYAGVCAVGERE
jgi:hypothetical protein